MEFNQRFQEMTSQYEPVGHLPFQQSWNFVSPSKTATENESNPCFDCNICLDAAHDPVVTLCGHLYCWPCIYKWIHIQSPSDEPEHQPKCPICKANISKSSLVPLYGRGTPTSESESKKPQLGLVIPVRPASQLRGLMTSTTTDELDQQYHTNPVQSHVESFHQHQYFQDASFEDFLMTPTSVVYGEMLYARMFGRSETSLYTPPSPNTFNERTNPRMRRQEMELYKSLNRVCIFFLCCIILCLFLF